jgi:hypothetical protein
MGSRSNRKPTFEDVQAAIREIETAIEVARSMGITLSRYSYSLSGNREWLDVSADIEGTRVSKTITLVGDDVG